MKKFLATLILILMFQTPSQADDIRDFQIEGMSIGDSALDYFSEEEIKNAKNNLYCTVTNNKKECDYFYSATFWDLAKFDIYDAVRFHAKNGDKKHVIYQLNGQIFFARNFENCIKKIKIILDETSEVIESLKKVYDGTYKHDGDKSGKSTVISVEYDFPNKDYFSVACYNWSDESGHPITLHITFTKKEFGHWLTKIYK